MARRTTGRITDRAIEAALWWRGFVDTNNKAFLSLFWDESRYLVLCGGGGSGKSVFAGRKVIERCAAEPGHRVLVCRKVGREIKESCYAQLVRQCDEYYPGRYKVNKSDMSITFDNGSKIITSGLDDVSKKKSIYEITDMWIEEAAEITQADFNQLDIRMRAQSPYYKQMILTFNPVSVTHWLKGRFFDSKDPRATTHKSTYKDNRFLRPEDIETLERFRETDEYYYTVYCLGEWGVTGKTVFDARALTELLSHIDKQDREQGVFTYDYDGLAVRRPEWTPGGGYITVYERPEPYAPYVIGADTAGTGSDFYAAQVLDNRDGRQVAVLHIRDIDEGEFARQLYCLGRWYNDALLAVETNFSTFCVRELQRLGYPRQYVREVFDDYTHKTTHAYGYRTDSKSRPVAIATLIEAVRGDVRIIRDRKTVEEMLTFVRTEDWRAEADAGAHDDLVIALAIAHHVRPRQSYLSEKPPAETVAWTEDMWEDYENSDPATRERLLKEWGRPSDR